eukprot:m.14685 g.14685  ORF g.14685 m.14685 type:complete len:600 (+) comp4355_c0_seq1:76-1875(+)
MSEMKEELEVKSTKEKVEEEEMGIVNEDDEDEGEEDEDADNEEVRWLEPFINDPAFMIPGSMKHRLGRTKFEKACENVGPCPNILCGTVCSTPKEMRFHLEEGLCTIKSNELRGMFEKLRTTWENKAHRVIFRAKRKLSVVHLRDQPIFPSYIWPLKTGEWHTPLVFVKGLMGVRDDPQPHVLKEWGVNFAKSHELVFLLSYEVVDPLLVSLGRRLQLVKSDAVLDWLEKNMPLARQRLEKTRSAPFLGLGALQRHSIVESIKFYSQEIGVAAQAFSDELTKARQEKTRFMYNPSFQLTMSARDQHMYIVGKKPKQRPFNLLPGQTKEKIEGRLDVFDAHPSSRHTDIPHNAKRHRFNMKEVYQSYLIKRARKKHGSNPQHEIGRREGMFCVVCNEYSPGEMMQCSHCHQTGHFKCLDISPALRVAIESYPWTCVDCKTCSVCKSADNETKILFCDECDRGYHTFCVELETTPRGRWICPRCAVCDGCGMTEKDLGSGIKWNHVVDRRDGARRFLKTLCDGCIGSWNMGQFCPACLDLYDGSEELVSCDTCGRKLHAKCEEGNINPVDKDGFNIEDAMYSCTLCKGEAPDLYDVYKQHH